MCQWSFFTQLPETAESHTAFLVFVDRLSKMVHFAPCKNRGCSVVHILLCGTFCQAWHALGDLSDRGTQLTSKFIKEVSKLLDVCLEL